MIGKSAQPIRDPSKKSYSKNQKILLEMIKEYEHKCVQYETAPCLSIKKALKRGFDEDVSITKFVIYSQDQKSVEYWDNAKLKKYTTNEENESFRALKKKRQKKRFFRDEKPRVKVLPFIEVLRSKCYNAIEELFVSDVYMDNSDMLALAGIMGKGNYSIKSIELIECFIDAKGINTFVSTASNCSTLRELILDFNEFGDEGCHNLCIGLVKSKWILRLSMCFCGIGKQSGIWLGNLVADSSIRELYLDGNKLEAEGTIALLSQLSEAATNEGNIRQETVNLKTEANAAKNAGKPRYDLDNLSQNPPNSFIEEEMSNVKDNSQLLNSETIKSKKTKKGKGKKIDAPPSGPNISILSLKENGISHIGHNNQFATIRCIQMLKTLIENSKDLQEVNIFGNDIGDLNARHLLAGLVSRRAFNLPQIILKVTHQISQDTFDAIGKLASGSKLKKKKKKR